MNDLPSKKLDVVLFLSQRGEMDLLENMALQNNITMSWLLRILLEEGIAECMHRSWEEIDGNAILGRRSPAKRTNFVKMRSNIAFRPDLVPLIDKMAAEHGITKADMIRILIVRALTVRVIEKKNLPIRNRLRSDPPTWGQKSMSRKYLDLRPERARYVHDSAHPPTDGLPRPAIGVLVGGASEYGNVRKIPDLLWKEYGIAIITQANTTSDLRSCSRKFHFALVLVDLVGHTIASDVKNMLEPGGKIVYAPSAWSHIAKGLADNHILPYAGRFLSSPTRSHRFPLEKAHADLRPSAEDETTAIRPSTPAHPAPPHPLDRQGAERLLGLTLSLSEHEQGPIPTPASPAPVPDMAPLVAASEPISVQPEPEKNEMPVVPAAVVNPPPPAKRIEPQEHPMSATPAPPEPAPLPVEKQSDLPLVVPFPLVGRLADLLLALDTPAVRAVTGKSVTTESVVQIALLRGIEALEGDLGIGS